MTESREAILTAPLAPQSAPILVGGCEGRVKRPIYGKQIQ
jgi:hypothetical protein